MGQKGKISGIILVILLILSLAGAGIGFYSYQKERLNVVALREELENLKVEKRIVDEKLAESRKRFDELNNQLQTTQREMEELNNELKLAKSERDQFYSQIEELQSQLKMQEEIKKQWETKQIQAQDRINELQAQLKGLQASKEELEAKITSLTKEKVSLGKIVVGQEEAAKEAAPVEVVPSQTPPQAPPTLEGKVLVVNKEYDFAVINLGSRDGLNPQDVFSVYHNNNNIGDIRVEKVQEIMSACGFVSKEIKNRIKEGDKVVLSKIVVGQEKAAKEAAPVEVVPSQVPPQAPPTLEGKVLVVNKEYDFAVINLGSRDGLNPQDVFSVYHNKINIGDIRVDKVQEIMSSCVFVSKEVKDKIREGDKVVRK